MQVLTEAADSISDIALRGTDLITSSIDGSIRTYDIRRGVLATDACSRMIVVLERLDCLASRVRLVFCCCRQRRLAP